MMTVSQLKRASVAADAIDILSRLPSLGRVMLALSRNGATHERLGPVDEVVREGGVLTIRGAGQDARIEVSALGAVIVDRSTRMKERILPKLEIGGHDGEALVTVYGLEGLEPFDSSLKPFGESPLPAKTREPSEPATLADDDAGLALLEAVCASGLPVAVEVSHPGILQRWEGAIAEVKPAMGFANIITTDFHLHLRGGAVARWAGRELEGGTAERIAENSAGQPIGLIVRGPAAAFGG